MILPGLEHTGVLTIYPIIFDGLIVSAVPTTGAWMYGSLIHYIRKRGSLTIYPSTIVKFVKFFQLSLSGRRAGELTVIKSQDRRLPELQAG